MTLQLPRSASGQPPVVVQVWGDGALFTRPEFKVERLTYAAMTPSAAIGVLEAIFWKPEFSWRPVRIEILKPIRQFTLRRNETHDLPSLSDAYRDDRTVNTSANRDQRSAVCLRDVAYRIHAHLDLRDHATKNEAAYRDQFRRRVTRGACFSQPYLGTREFPAAFADPDNTPPIDVTDDLGVMLHSIHHDTPTRFEWFRAQLESGVLQIPTHGIDPTSTQAARPTGARQDAIEVSR
jgi:CRISPR-associated protein Cas5d